MSKLNFETIEAREIKPDTRAMVVKSVTPGSANMKPPFRRLFGRVFSPTIRQVLLVLSDQGFQSITNFVLGILLARFLSKTDYGVFVALMSVILIAQGSNNSLISQPSTVYAPKMRSRKRAIYLGSTFVHQVIAMTIITLVFAVTGVVMLLLRFKTSSIYVIWLLCATTGLVMLRPFARFLLLSTFRHELAFLMGTITNILQCSLIVFLYIWDLLSVPVTLAVIAGTNSIIALAVLGFVAYRRILIIKMRYVVRDFKRNWQFGKWNLGRMATSFCAAQLYPIALAVLLAPTEAAVYGVCMGLAGISNPVIMGLGVFLGPHMAKQARRINYTKLIQHTNAAFFCIGVFLVVYVLLISVWGERLVVLLYGEKYAGNLMILLIIALAVAVEGLACPAVATINALERPKLLFTSRLLAAVFTLTGGILCLYFFGLLGAAAGLLTGSIITTSMRCLWLWKRLYRANTRELR